MEYSQPLIESALASLDEGLPARLAVFNAIAGNPQLELPPVLPPEERDLSGVESWRAFYFGGRETHFVFPAIEIAVPDDSLDDFSLGHHDADATANVVVVTWVQDKDATLTALYTMLLGYGRCVREVLTGSDAFNRDPTIGRVNVARVRGRNTSPDPEIRKFEYRTLARFDFFTVEFVPLNV